MKLLKKYLSNQKTILSIIVGLVLVIISVVHFTIAADFQLFGSLGGDKTQVTPGESLQYVVTVRNDGTQNLTNVRVNQNFISQVTYVNGSTTAEKNNQTINVPDNWTGSGGFNFGTLTPGQTGYLKFTATVSGSAAVGSSLQNAVAIVTDQTGSVGQAHTVTVVSANQVAVLRGGDFLKVTNNTLQNGWNDSVTVGPSDVVEFLTKISNDGQFDARNVKLSANLPSSPATIQNPSVTLSADNAQSVTDSVTVQGFQPFWFVFKIGHATLFGNTELYNCPTGCRIPESFYLSPLNLGTVKPGESASIQVTFKADIFTPGTPTVTPTPTPTPTPTVTPTPTPTVTPTPTPTVTPSPNPTSTCTNLTASTTSGTRPLTITFVGSGSDSAGNIQQYQFNFGDNSNGQDQIVTTNSNQASHVYNNAGNFNANLLVKDSRGNWVGGGSCQVNINVNNPPTVLGTSAPTVLPKTGSNDGVLIAIASIPTILGGIYLYRRFKLL